MAEGRLVTSEELEQLVAQRMKQRAEIISEAVTALKPILEGMRNEITAANHIKRTLGRQLTTLARLQRETNVKLDSHTHPQTDAAVRRLNDAVEVVGELGVDTLSVEQRKALPEVLEEKVRSRKEGQLIDRRERRRDRIIQLAMSLIGTVAAVLVAYAAIIAYNGSHHQ